MEYEIIDSYWFTGMRVGTVGVVVIKTGRDLDNWKAYIGSVVIPGTSQKVDELEIAKNGAKFPIKATCALFPALDPEKGVN